MTQWLAQPTGKFLFLLKAENSFSICCPDGWSNGNGCCQTKMRLELYDRGRHQPLHCLKWFDLQHTDCDLSGTIFASITYATDMYTFILISVAVCDPMQAPALKVRLLTWSIYCILLHLQNNVRRGDSYCCIWCLILYWDNDLWTWTWRTLMISLQASLVWLYRGPKW